MKPIKKSERGQALILIVFGLIALVGFSALAVDGGNALMDRRQAQNAADAAALSSALAKIRGQNYVMAATAVAAANGYDPNNDPNTGIQVANPPLDGPYKGNPEYIQVLLTSKVDTYFASVLGYNQITNQVEAVARAKPPEIKEMFNGNAMVSLAPTSDCENNKAFVVEGEGTLDISGGGILVNSNNSECALIQRGSGSIRLDPGYTINIAGGASIQKPKLLTPYPPTTNAGQVSYPPPFEIPHTGCPKPAEVSEDGTSMSAGGYGGDIFPPEGVTHLGSGTYCIDHDVHITGSLSGSNILLYIKHGEFRVNGSAKVELSALKSGKLAGLLILLPIDNHSKVVLNGSSDSSFKGTILAPSSTIVINGNSSTNGFHSQIIGYHILSKGTDNVVIKYNDEQNYDALSFPVVELIK